MASPLLYKSCGYLATIALSAALIVCQDQAGAENPTDAVEKTVGSSFDLRTNPVDGADMVFIPSGEFVMGSDPEEIDRVWDRFGWDDQEKQFTKAEQPSHRVRVDGFWMYRNLVTVAQYRRFCDATGGPMPEAPSYGWVASHPMANVSWEDAKAYCSWAGGRLPHEAEWEYAARGGNTGIGGRPRTVFVWGDALPTIPVGNLADETFMDSGYYDNPNFDAFVGYVDGFATVSPVGSFPPNGFGLHDMAGNVLEWCEDWFAEDYYRSAPTENPRGPVSGESRVLRGGAFDTIPTITRIARRLRNDPSVRHEEKGFRCVQEN